MNEYWSLKTSAYMEDWRKALCATLLLIVFPVSAYAADGSMHQVNGNNTSGFYDGPVQQISLIGLNSWSGLWPNNHGQTHHLQYKYDPSSKTVDVLELESNQHWIGNCSMSATILACSGKLATDNAFTFDTVLPLP